MIDWWTFDRENEDKGNSKNCNMLWFYQLTITNSYGFESNSTALNNGKTVNKPKGLDFK